MLITCPQCWTSYDVAAAKLGSEGRSVRCARCQSQWLAKSSDEEPASDDAAWGMTAPADPVERSGVQALATAGPPAAADTETSVEDWGMPAPAEIVDAPPLAPVSDEPHAGAEAVTDTDAIDIESLAARQSRIVHPKPPRRRLRAPRPGLMVLALAAVLAALIGWRAQIVRLLPQTAPVFATIGLPVNLRGLVFEDLGVAGESEGDVPVLVVHGVIRNITPHQVAVPRLRFALRSPGGLEVYAWTILPDKAILGPYATLPFHSRLASPPSDTKDVMVRFFGRQDVNAGL
jgi:predicted Zn finger-like uncharacterized protein